MTKMAMRRKKMRKPILMKIFPDSSCKVASVGIVEKTLTELRRLVWGSSVIVEDREERWKTLERSWMEFVED